ncbi:acyl-CoA thioester hydrolase/BAAT C-terminal domain-containing protein [Angustibacter peucedani]
MTEAQPVGPGVHGLLLEPDGPPRAAVVVLSGSSGRLEVGRAQLLADQGALALALQWFGGPDQPPGICEVPLETLVSAVDLLRQRAPGVRVGAIGLSKGAELALATSVVCDRLDAVVALAPTHVVWANVGPGADGETYPYRSSWTWQGRPLPFVTYDETWEPGPAPVANIEIYRRSLLLDPARTDAARIDVGAAAADLLLVGGGDDHMWDGVAHARELESVRVAASRPVEVVTHPAAGHRVRFPGEPAVPPSELYDHGGTPEADAALGALAWPRVLATLGLV